MIALTSRSEFIGGLELRNESLYAVLDGDLRDAIAVRHCDGLAVFPHLGDQQEDRVLYLRGNIYKRNRRIANYLNSSLPADSNRVNRIMRERWPPLAVRWHHA